MSHFTVLVIGDNIEDQLSSYQENNMGDCPKEFLVFNDVEDEYRERYAKEKTEMVKMPDGKLISRYDSQFKKIDAKTLESEFVLPEGAELLEIPMTEAYPTFDLFMDDYAGYKKDPDRQKYGYWENPNAKWDWYQVGGRWTGYFRLKEGAQGVAGRPGLGAQQAEVGWADQVRKRDIDFAAMRDHEETEARKRYRVYSRVFGGTIPTVEQRWKDVLARESLGDIEKKRDFYWSQPALKRLKELRQTSKTMTLTAEERDALIWNDLEDYQCSEDEYAKRARAAAISTFAIVKDGKWYEKGSMGWWGVVSDEKCSDDWITEFERLLDGLPDDTLLTVVDCHI